MGQLSELLNIERRGERRREELARLFDKMAKELNLIGAKPEELREELNRLIDYPYGVTVQINPYRGSDGYLYAEIPKERLQNYLGQKECIFAMRANGRNVYRKYGPDKERHKHLVPEWIGAPGEKVKVRIRRISLIEFLEAATKEGLPFELKMTDHGIRIIVDSREIGAKISEFGWEPGSATVAYAKVLIRDFVGNEHALKIDYDGYGEPTAMIVMQQSHQIIDIHYNDPMKELSVLYKKGSHQAVHTIVLEYIPHVRIAEGRFDRCEGYVSTDLIKEARRFSSTGKGMTGCKIAEEVLRKSGFMNLHTTTTSNNAAGEGDRRFDIFDVSGYLNHEFIGCEVKLTTVSELEMHQDLDSNWTELQLLANMDTWNDPNWRYKVEGDPLVRKGLIVSIYIDTQTGQFKLASKWTEAPEQGGEV